MDCSYLHRMHDSGKDLDFAHYDDDEDCHFDYYLLVVVENNQIDSKNDCRPWDTATWNCNRWHSNGHSMMMMMMMMETVEVALAWVAGLDHTKPW
jgi:hypothetical protein